MRQVWQTRTEVMMKPLLVVLIFCTGCLAESEGDQQDAVPALEDATVAVHDDASHSFDAATDSQDEVEPCAVEPTLLRFEFGEAPESSWEVTATVGAIDLEQATLVFLVGEEEISLDIPAGFDPLLEEGQVVELVGRCSRPFWTESLLVVKREGQLWFAGGWTTQLDWINQVAEDMFVVSIAGGCPPEPFGNCGATETHQKLAFSTDTDSVTLISGESSAVEIDGQSHQITLGKALTQTSDWCISDQIEAEFNFIIGPPLTTAP